MGAISTFSFSRTDTFGVIFFYWALLNGSKDYILRVSSSCTVMIHNLHKVRELPLWSEIVQVESFRAVMVVEVFALGKKYFGSPFLIHLGMCAVWRHSLNLYVG